MIADFYRILGKSCHGTHATYDILLPTACEVYKGHFPNEPVVPGVCSIQMLHELAEDCIADKLNITGIKQCRFIGLLCPSDDNILHVDIDFTDLSTIPVTMRAVVRSDNSVFIKLCAELSL